MPHRPGLEFALRLILHLLTRTPAATSIRYQEAISAATCLLRECRYTSDQSARGSSRRSIRLVMQGTSFMRTSRTRSACSYIPQSNGGQTPTLMVGSPPKRTHRDPLTASLRSLRYGRYLPRGHHCVDALVRSEGRLMWRSLSLDWTGSDTAAAT